jgi:hypothetical protein
MGISKDILTIPKEKCTKLMVKRRNFCCQLKSTYELTSF